MSAKPTRSDEPVNIPRPHLFITAGDPRLEDVLWRRRINAGAGLAPVPMIVRR